MRRLAATAAARLLQLLACCLVPKPNSRRLACAPTDTLAAWLLADSPTR